MYKTLATFLIKFFIDFLNFFSCIWKISKDSSAKYYQDNKERVQKKAWERYQSFSKEEKEKIIPGYEKFFYYMVNMQS